MARTLIFGLLFFCPPALKPWILRVFCGAQVGQHVHIGWFTALMGRHIALGDHCELRAFTLIRCDGTISIGRYAVVSSFNLIYGAAGLFVGEHAYIGPQCLINNDEDVRLGRFSALGARCMVYTHGSFLPYTEGYWVRFGPVTLGDYVWCAAGVFLHPGTSIGDNVFVNSRSVVSGTIAADQVVEGFPARPVAAMERMRRKMTPARLDAAAGTMLRHFVEMILVRAYGLACTEHPGGLFECSYHGVRYRLGCINSQGQVPAPATTRDIWLVTRPGWHATGPNTLVFDLITMQMSAVHDPIYHELGLFMKRYYGIQCEYMP